MSSQKTQASEAKITLVVDFFGGCSLFCGEQYALENDPKNPRRWRKAFLC